MFTRDDRTARELLARALSRAREVGGVGLLPRILVPVALLETWEGAYPSARAHASERERLSRDTGQDHLLAHFVGLLAWIAAARGEVEDCKRLSSRALELAHAYRVRPSIAIGTSDELAQQFVRPLQQRNCRAMDPRVVGAGPSAPD